MEEDEQEDQDGLQTQTLALFDLLWSRHLILFNLPPPPLPPAPPSPPPPTPPTKLLHRRSVHRRSQSDDLSPTLKIQTPKLQTIFSGKESTESLEIRAEKERGWRKQRERRRRKKTTGESSSKSLSDLEFEELKGFMDLGFTFSDADSDPRLREIVPGLQRLKPAGGDQDVPEGSPSASSADDVAVVARPYLSEAWDAKEQEEEEERRRRRKFGIKMGGNKMDLKDQLRFWAQAVASTVR